MYGNIFATVSGTENLRQKNKITSDNSLLMNILKLTSVLIQINVPIISTTGVSFQYSFI